MPVGLSAGEGAPPRVRCAAATHTAKTALLELGSRATTGLGARQGGGTREGALFRARQTLSGQELHAWDTLSGSLASWADGEAVARAYAQSLLLVDHLARQYSERLVLQLVEGCGRGLPPEATFRDQLQLDLWETVAAEGL